MQTQKSELLQQISAQGWSVSTVEDWQLDWWADEMWLLESQWFPVGKRAYLTFLVDPQISHTRARKKGEAVWAIQVSPLKPIDRVLPDGSFRMSLNNGWQKELSELIKHLSLLRGQSQ